MPAPTLPIRILTGGDVSEPSDPVRVNNWTQFITAVSLFLTIPASNTAYVEVNGDDTTGAVGDKFHPFQTIAAAMSYITDAATDNRYAVNVGVGQFTEDVTLPPYISLAGRSYLQTQIVGTLSVEDAGVHEVSGIQFIQNAIAPGSIVTFVNSPTILFERCLFTQTILAAVPHSIMTGTVDVLLLKGCDVNTTMLYVGNVAQTLINVAGGTLVWDGGNPVILAPTPVAGDITVWGLDFDDNVVITAQRVAIILIQPYADTLRIVDVSGGSLKTLASNTVSVVGNGGTATYYSVDSGATGSIGISSSDLVNYVGFTTNNVSDVATNDTFAISFSSFSNVSSPRHIGAGTVSENSLVSGAFTTNIDIIDENTYITGSTNTSLQDLFNIGFSAGWVSGGVITDNADGTIAVTGGTGVVRDANNESAPLYMFDWAADDPISLTDNSWNYIIVCYNAGSPQLDVILTDPNENNCFELYEVYRNGNTLTIEDHKHRSVNVPGKVQEWVYDVFGISRGGRSGLLLGETGTRNITVTSGSVWIKFVETDVAAINTSTGSSFDRYYYNGAAWVEQSAQTQWDNTQWNDITSGLTTMLASKYSYQDFYLLGNGRLACLYGQAEYTSVTDARGAPRSAIYPTRVDDEHSIYIGRITFQKNDATALYIDSPFLAVA